MAQEHIFLNDIISDHRERMLNLKKYYPFFKLIEVSFSQYKEGKYEILDMGYIVMAVLRFFIEENNFKEKDVTYPEYLEFISKLLRRDFGLTVTSEEEKDIADYVFDKFKNDGRPFCFEYFDPIDRKKRMTRMKIVESRIIDNTVWYSISHEAVEFYLDTKEIKDESKISVQQLLLEKMIRSQNFKGGTEVVVRINEEVNRLQIKKNEVLNILANDVFAGIEAYENFVDTGMRWFEEEEKLFEKNKELIETALKKAEDNGNSQEQNVFFKTISDIYELENQLKIAMNKHGELLRACIDMQKMTDDIVRKTKISRLRSRFDFSGMLGTMIQHGDADILELAILPLLKLKTKKTFPVFQIDDALDVKPEKYEKAEKIVKEHIDDIVFEDELEDERIRYNYIFLMNNLLTHMEDNNEFTLEEWNEYLKNTYSADVLKNADYYSFMIHLCQKKSYIIGGQAMENESFLDEILNGQFQEHERTEFNIMMAEGSEKVLLSGNEFETSDITFVKVMGTVQNGGEDGNKES